MAKKNKILGLGYTDNTCLLNQLIDGLLKGFNGKKNIESHQPYISDLIIFHHQFFIISKTKNVNVI